MNLYLYSKKRLTKNIFQFSFRAKKSFNFSAGQYLEWQLPHRHADARGQSRLFTIASSPTEEKILVVSRFTHQKSSFKKAFQNLKINQKITISAPNGNFTLSSKSKDKYIFIASGIGITPFRSITKCLLDTKTYRQITLFYLVKKEEMLFKDIFQEAKKIGLETIYMTRAATLEDKIKSRCPDYKTRLFYLSGSEEMVRNTAGMLIKTGVKKEHLHQDYFPGY